MACGRCRRGRGRWSGGRALVIASPPAGGRSASVRAPDSNSGCSRHRRSRVRDRRAKDWGCSCQAPGSSQNPIQPAGGRGTRSEAAGSSQRRPRAAGRSASVRASDPSGGCSRHRTPRARAGRSARRANEGRRPKRSTPRLRSPRPIPTCAGRAACRPESSSGRSMPCTCARSRRGISRCAQFVASRSLLPLSTRPGLVPRLRSYSQCSILGRTVV
jgi:hypothetical protein